MTERWAIQWHSKNLLDGEQRHWCWNGTVPFLFRTRQSAREEIKKRWGYIAHQPHLRREPHGWRMPRAVKVRVVLEEVAGE
jgi:hypothetical protein